MLRSALLLLSLLITTLCFPQKSSNTTLTIPFVVHPTGTVPEKPVTWSSKLNTQLGPLSDSETEKLAKTYLGLSGSKYIAATTNTDWTIALTTGEATSFHATDKMIKDMGMDETVATYTLSSKLVITDKSGAVVYEKVLSDPAVEQSMPKRALFFNPRMTANLVMAGSNAEKHQKIYTSALTDSKNRILLLTMLTQADKALSDTFEQQSREINVSVFSVKGKAYEELDTQSDKIFEAWKKYNAFSKKNRIPKSDVDKVMNDAIPVWEKYIAEHKELEEKATKGLILNCALANIWTGNFDKANSYLAQVPEAASAPVYNAEESEGANKSSSHAMGATVFLSFKQSAENLRDLYNNFKDNQGKITINE